MQFLNILPKRVKYQAKHAKNVIFPPMFWKILNFEPIYLAHIRTEGPELWPKRASEAGDPVWQ